MMLNESTIEQINLGFNPQEDRLLLKVGLSDKTEVVAWITRRVCKTMCATLEAVSQKLSPNIQTSAPDLVATGERTQVIERFKNEVMTQKIIENLDFRSEYNAGRQARTKAPMLVTNCLTISVDHLPPQLELQCTTGQSVKMALTSELVLALTSMMQMATREAGWDLVFTLEHKQTNVLPKQQTVH